MNDRELSLKTIEFRRISTLKDSNPFCRICGKANAWANYHNHHVDLRRYSDDQIFVCQECHQEIHAMLNTFPKIPSTIPASRHAIIHMVRGQIVIHALSNQKLEQLHDWLLNEIDLPPTPVPGHLNDNGVSSDGFSAAGADASGETAASTKEGGAK